MIQVVVVWCVWGWLSIRSILAPEVLPVLV
jgi:hypothetical protein